MAGSTTSSRDSQVHASWIACFVGACWIPLGMWIWFLQALWGAGHQERMGIALAGPYLTLIAGFCGALVGCVGLSMLRCRGRGAGKAILVAGTVAGLLPAAFAAAVLVGSMLSN